MARPDVEEGILRRGAELVGGACKRPPRGDPVASFESGQVLVDAELADSREMNPRAVNARLRRAILAVSLSMSHGSRDNASIYARPKYARDSSLRSTPYRHSPISWNT